MCFSQVHFYKGIVHGVIDSVEEMTSPKCSTLSQRKNEKYMAYHFIDYIH
jgi:hypothetical protein